MHAVVALRHLSRLMLGSSCLLDLVGDFSLFGFWPWKFRLHDSPAPPLASRIRNSLDSTLSSVLVQPKFKHGPRPIIIFVVVGRRTLRTLMMAMISLIFEAQGPRDVRLLPKPLELMNAHPSAQSFPLLGPCARE